MVNMAKKKPPQESGGTPYANIASPYGKMMYLLRKYDAALQ
jgi:hypothetical protein